MRIKRIRKERGFNLAELMTLGVNFPLSINPVRYVKEKYMIDVNKPVTNPELVAAIDAMGKNNTKENQDQVINEVMKAHFISPVTISPVPEPSGNSGEVIIKEKTKISFSIIENTANQHFFLAFTDWDELRKWHISENQQTVILTFDDLAAMVLDEKGSFDGFVINPFGGNVTFNKTMIKALKEEKERRARGGVIEHVVEKDTAVQLGQPRVYPKEMVKAISDYLKNQKNVKSAYLQLMIKEGEQSYLIIVDISGDIRETFDGIANIARSYLKGMFLDLAPYDSGFGRNATKNIQPFYKRKKFGLF